MGLGGEASAVGVAKVDTLGELGGCLGMEVAQVQSLEEGQLHSFLMMLKLLIASMTLGFFRSTCNL